MTTINFFFHFHFSSRHQRVLFFYSKYPFNTDCKQFIFRFSFILRIVLLLLFKSFTEDLYYNKFIFQVHQVSEYFFFYLNHPFTIHDYNQSISGFILALGIIQYFSICSNNLLKNHDYYLIINQVVSYTSLSRARSPLFKSSIQEP